MEIVLIVGLAFLWPLAAWSFGWAVLGRIDGLDRAERFVASFGVGFAAFAACQFVAFLTRAPQPTATIVSLVLLGVLAVVCSLLPKRSVSSSGDGLLGLAGLLTLGYLHLFCIQALLPLYLGSNWWGDWHHHFLATRVFLRELPVEKEWGGTGMYTVASRTPLFDLATAFPLNLTGTHFWAYQAASVAPSYAFAGAVYLLLRDLYGLRAARLGLLLAPLNLWMLHNAWFTWPKMLAAYFLLLALHFYLQAVRRRLSDPAMGRRYFLYFWLAGFLSYLTHQVAAVYVVALVLHALWLVVAQRAWRARLLDLPVLALVAVLILAPWYGWLIGHFGIARVIRGSPTTQMAEETSGPRYFVESVGSNLATSVVPIHLVEVLRGDLETEDARAEAYRAVTELYFSLLTGALTLSLTIFLGVHLLGSILRGRWRPAADSFVSAEGSAVWIFAGLGTLLAAFLVPLRWSHGIAHAALFTSVVLFAALAWGLLARAGRFVSGFVIAAMLAEFLIVFWSHIWLLLTQPHALDRYYFNFEIKSDEKLMFLTDALALSSRPLIVVVLLIQVGLIAALIWWGKQDDPDAAPPTTSI